MGQKTMFRAAAHAIGGWQQTWSRFTVRPVRPGVVLAALLWATCAISAEGAKAPNLERRAVAVESAASAVAPRPTIAFKLATEEFPSGNVQLSNGKEVTVSDWPTIVVARIAPGSLSSSASKASCTAVLVGPKVILTAAHCVDDPLSATALPASLKVDGRTLRFDCTINPTYLDHETRFQAPRGSEDYALCLLDDQGVLPPTLQALRYDVLDISSSLRRHEAVVLVGFGCTELRVVDHEFVYKEADGNLRIGDEQVEHPAPAKGPSAAYITMRSPNGQEATLCPGDSGGPVFSGISTTSPQGKRRVRAVNSMIRPDKKDTQYDVLSFAAVTTHKGFVAWIRKWAKSHNPIPLICGVTHKAGEPPCLQ